MVQREAVPEVKALQDDKFLSSSPFYSVLHKTITALCDSVGWVQPITKTQNFCWGVIASCCEKIPITDKEIHWVGAYECVITCLGKICNLYFKEKELPKKCLLSAVEFPQEITHNPSDHIRK